MSQENPTNEEEWERFRFPARVVRKPEEAQGDTSSEEEEGDGEEGRGSGGGPSLDVPGLPEAESPTAGTVDQSLTENEEPSGDRELPPISPWEYQEETGFLVNVTLGKKIDLDHLDEASKIRRLFAVFDLRPDLDFPTLMGAMEKASQVRFAKPLKELLEDHAQGQTISWKGRPAAGPGLG